MLHPLDVSSTSSSCTNQNNLQTFPNVPAAGIKITPVENTNDRGNKLAAIVRLELKGQIKLESIFTVFLDDSPGDVIRKIVKGLDIYYCYVSFA